MTDATADNIKASRYMNQIPNQDTVGEAIERVIAQGDLSKLTPEQRVRYYNDVCKSLDLNPLTRPFEYITLNGKLVLYARKDATEQLRVKKGISIKITAREKADDVYLVTAQATDKTGRVDESIGAVSVGGLKGDAMANAVMKCETKAKRRVTLSISGLGFTDESELETIPGAQRYTIRIEATQIVAEMESCAEREQLDAFFASRDVMEYLARADEAAPKSGMSQGDYVRQMFHQIRDKLTERKEDKRAVVKSLDEYPSAGASSAIAAPAAPSVPQPGPSQPPDIPAALDRRGEPDESEITEAERKEMDWLASIDSCDTIKGLGSVGQQIEKDAREMGEDRTGRLRRAWAQRRNEIDAAASLQ